MCVRTKRWRKTLSFLAISREGEGLWCEIELEKFHCLCAKPFHQHLASNGERERNYTEKCGETLRTE